MNLIVDLICLGFMYLFFPNKQNDRDDTENAAAYFFGSANIEKSRNDKSEPVNSDYDNGPDWG